MSSKYENQVRLEHFLRYVNELAKDRFGEVKVDVSISNMPDAFVSELSDSGHYQLKHNGRYVDVYSESHLPFDDEEFEIQHIDEVCEVCGGKDYHQLLCPNKPI